MINILICVFLFGFIAWAALFTPRQSCAHDWYAANSQAAGGWVSIRCSECGLTDIATAGDFPVRTMSKEEDV